MGFFFHLSQNFFRKVQESNLKDYATDNEFRLYYKLMQALAFVPEDDVVEAFLLLRTSSPAKFKPILEYLEVYYIGKLVPLSRTFDKLQLFQFQRGICINEF